MILTVSNMRGGACSEDTGEDGKEDRQLHMQKTKDTFPKETFTKSVSSETLLFSVTVAVSAVPALTCLSNLP